jgi:hypothetical protein
LRSWESPTPCSGGEELRTRTGLPLYYGASVTSAGGWRRTSRARGRRWRPTGVRAPAEEVYSWTEAKMAKEGWTKGGGLVSSMFKIS